MHSCFIELLGKLYFIIKKFLHSFFTQIDSRLLEW